MSKFRSVISKTREVSLVEFERIWALGGWDSGSQQFLNYQSHDYLWVVNEDAREAFNRLEAEASQAWEDYRAGRGELATAVLKSADCRDFERSALRINNITQYGHKSRGLSPLPANWDECFLEFSKYPFKNDHARLLLARNNHDGTVQLFRVP